MVERLEIPNLANGGLEDFVYEINDCIHFIQDKLYNKDIPMKPIEVDDDFSYFVCGNCEFTVGYMDEKETHKFCLNCGQKIDWEGTEI